MHLGQKKSGHVALAVALTLAATTAARADITTTFSGFGTVGGSFTSNANYNYSHDASEFTKASNQLDIGLDSRLGLQGKVDFGNDFSITAQEVFRERGGNEFDPGTEWLYVQYAPTSDWSFKLGRVILPVFLYSDSRQVGYATPWFRAAPEVYGAFPFDFVDGGQISWQHTIGEFTIAAQGTTGSTSGTFQGPTVLITTNAHDIFNESISVTYGDLLLRVANTTFVAPTTIPLSSTFTLDYQQHEKIVTAGAQYDNGHAVLIGEWVKTKENALQLFNEPLTEATGYDVSAGWRFNKFLPLVTYGNNHEEAGLLSAPYTKASWSATLRYDVVSNLALKAEVTRAKANNQAFFGEATASADPNSNQNLFVYSIGADFVF